MKKYKIYKKNNYIVVTDNITSETFYGRAKDVMVDKSNTNRAAYRFFNILDLKEGTSLTIDQILKEDGSPYTSDEFDTFYTQNTGNFNGGGTAPIIDLISTDSDNSIELGSDGKLWSGGGSTPDATPTDGSSNAVSSNGVFDALALKQDTLTETNFGAFMNARTAKNTLVDADEVVSDDSADSNKAKKTTWLNVWLNYLKPKADALYAPLSSVSTIIKLSADVTSTITTETVVSDFNYAVSANSTYIIRGRLAIGCNGTGGVNLGSKFPSGAINSGNAIGRTATSSSFFSVSLGTNGTLSGALNAANSQFGFAFVEAVLTVGATAGNFELIFASVIAGQTSTIIANGSYLEYIKL